MAKYGISKKAIADLDNIWNHTAQIWSEEQAVKYYRESRILHEKMDYTRHF